MAWYDVLSYGVLCIMLGYVSLRVTEKASGEVSLHIVGITIIIAPTTVAADFDCE